ncbi:MAG: hypothetical protein V2I63_04650 [Pseudomonadales bacterium]|jgi:hypothetical protein|nr:hypothetical protein [Pseudomonadales bacterium]
MIGRVLLAFVLAVLVTEVLAALASTQFVLAALGELGVRISWSDRLATSLHDIVGMTGIYLPVIAAALLIGFSVCALVVRRLGADWARIGYPLAGFVGVLTAIELMIAIFDIVPIAGARTLAGLLCQGLAGAVGGWLFAMLRPGARSLAA